MTDQATGARATATVAAATVAAATVAATPAPVRICDTILRDAHQSLLATRMRTDDMLPIAAKLDNVGYWSVEMWGGATFDSAMRFLNEDPWERIRKLKARMPNTPFQMLLRGQNVVGYKHYPDDVLDRFVVKAHENGIDVFRVFDALNDVRNMRRAIELVRREGAHAQGAISYTISPVHSVDTFVELAHVLEDMGSHTICVKDMAGLLSPYVAHELIGRLKDKIGVPIQLHTHYTSGMAMASVLKAIEAGVDIVDTAISSLAMVTSQPPTETLVRILQESPRDTGLDLALLAEISTYFANVRKKYAAFESGMQGVDVNVLQFQIPGGMLSNLVSQLREQGAEDRYAEVLVEVPRVREELGFPPLVTPSSQIVGTQATLNVILGERYKVIPAEVKNYVRGYYGRPPGPVDPEIRRKAIGDEAPIDCRPADLIAPGLDQARAEIGDLAESEEDVISYALFPQVARPFLERRRRQAGGEREALVAAVAALLVQRETCRPGGVVEKAGLSVSPWKVAWRPQRGRWGGLPAGAGGAQ
ncbi:MAG TPA: pyruvate/oxaloacetate carboxyltransferase [Anaerolineae bacterium]|nr:pyruvate/oxaloacetate carboxyltransferase [Anaerolineae bacterium]